MKKQLKHSFLLSLYTICLIGVSTFFSLNFSGRLFIFQNSDNIPLLTSEEKKWLSENDRKIVLASDPAFAPLAFIEDNIHKGLTADYFHIIEKKLNIKFKRINNIKTWSDLLEKGKNKEVDVFGATAKTPERTNYLLFTQSYINLPTVIITRQSVRKNLKLKDLANKKIAVSSNYSVINYLKKNQKKIRYHYTLNDLEGLKSVSLGDSFAVITDMLSASYFIEKAGLTNLKISGETGFIMKLTLATRKDIPILNRILIKTLDSFSQYEKKELYRKWVKIEYKRFLYSRNFWLFIIITIGTILLIIGTIAIWNSSLRHMVKKRTEELQKYKEHLEDLVEARTADLKVSNNDLKSALKQIKTINGLLPICASCKKIRDDKGYWEQIEKYVEEHSDAQFSHGICPQCADKLYGDQDWYKKNSKP